MSEPSGRCVQLSLPHFTPVIFHPNARGAPASDWDASAEEHAAPERTSPSPTPPAIPSTTMRARRRSGHVVAEMLVATAGLVTLAVRQTIAQPDFLHTNDAAAGHKFTIKLQWHQTLRSSRLVAAICAGRVRERTNRFAAAQSSKSACLPLIHNTL